MVAIRLHFVLIVASVATMIGCADCPKTVISRVQSQDAHYTAEVFSRDCGGATPHNMRVKLTKNGTSDDAEVFRLTDVPYDVILKWQSPLRLIVTVECSLNTPEACLPARDQVWDLSKRRTWDTVQIDYEVGPNLRRIGTESIIQRITR